MTSKTVIKINPQKPSKLEFDVVISGLEDTTPKVRFVLCDVRDGLDWVAHCTSVGDNRWAANLPVLKGLKSTQYNFRVEVVAEEYFFTPAYGEISLVTIKDVDFAQKTKKPTVSASFDVTQEDSPPPKKAPVGESFSAASASAGGATGGGSSPTTALLSPEIDGSVPQEDIPNPGMYDVQPDDEPELSYTASITMTTHTPGDTELPIPVFDPKTVAASIIKNKMGNVTRPTTKGVLFNRSSDGQAVISGLESPAAKKTLADKAAKVKEILKSV